MNRSVHRIALQPVACRQTQQPTTLEIVHQQQTNNLATLSRNPRDLYLLWSEYEFGIGNRKPAREFTAVERGRVKYNYHRRKVVWDKIAELVQAGWTSDMAIDAIYNAYGRHLPVRDTGRLSMQCGGIGSMEGIPHYRFKSVDSHVIPLLTHIGKTCTCLA